MPLAAREIVSSPDGTLYYVRALPKGGLKEATPTSGPLTYFTEIPLEMGLLGLFINKVIYRGRWIVVVSPLERGKPYGKVWSQEARKMAEANDLATRVMDDIRTGKLAPRPVQD